MAKLHKPAPEPAQRPITVMQLSSSLKHDESERGIYEIAHALIKQGHRSVVISNADADDELVHRLTRDGSHHHTLAMPKKSWLALRHIFALRRLITQHRPDVIHVHSRTPAWVLHWALQPLPAHKRPKIVSIMYGFYPLNKYAQALFDADALITASTSIDSYLKKKLRRLNHNEPHPYSTRLVCIRRGVDVRKYRYRHHVSVHWLQQKFAEFPALEHKRWLVFPTPIDHEYGQEWLIDILGNLKEKYPDIHLVIMDDDNTDTPEMTVKLAYEDFRQRTASLGLSDDISYVGKRPSDLKEWLTSADVVLALAGKPESIGITILKAIHLGTPVIGWNKGADGDILRELYPQGLVKEMTAKSLTRAIASQLDCGSRPAMTHRYEQETMVAETLALYLRLAGVSTQANAASKAAESKPISATSSP